MPEGSYSTDPTRGEVRVRECKQMIAALHAAGIGVVMAVSYTHLMSAEYIMAGGNEQVILCERGIRTFEKYTRNTLDLSAVPIIHEKTHLPIIVDPSHATGKANLVEPMMIAAVAAGADGLEVDCLLYTSQQARQAGRGDPDHRCQRLQYGVYQEPAHAPCAV